MLFSEETGWTVTIRFYLPVEIEGGLSEEEIWADRAAYLQESALIFLNAGQRHCAKCPIKAEMIKLKSKLTTLIF